jgi:hypothetical protein
MDSLVSQINSVRILTTNFHNIFSDLCPEENLTTVVNADTIIVVSLFKMAEIYTLYPKFTRPQNAKLVICLSRIQ